MKTNKAELEGRLTPHKTRQESQRRHKRYTKLMQSIFSECERQAWQPSEDPEIDTENIAIASFRITKDSAREARQRGQTDEEFVRNMLLLEEQASHQTLPEHTDAPPRCMARRASLPGLTLETLLEEAYSCSSSSCSTEDVCTGGIATIPCISTQETFRSVMTRTTLEDSFLQDECY